MSDTEPTIEMKSDVPMLAPPDPVFWRHDQLTNAEGMTIWAKLPFDGTGAQCGPATFYGKGAEMVQFPEMPMPQPFQFDFDIPASNPMEAFANAQAAYPAGKDKAMAKLKRDREAAQQQAAKRIVIAGAVNQSMPVANGHPKTRFK